MKSLYIACITLAPCRWPYMSTYTVYLVSHGYLPIGLVGVRETMCPLFPSCSLLPAPCLLTPYRRAINAILKDMHVHLSSPPQCPACSLYTALLLYLGFKVSYSLAIYSCRIQIYAGAAE